MEIKKKPEAQLENYSVLFLQIGLVLSLFCVYVVLEHKTYEKKIANFHSVVLTDTQDEILVIIHRTPPTATPPPTPPEATEIIDDTKEIEETIIESALPDEEEAVEATLDLDDIHEAVEGEEIIEDVPFAVIEGISVYPSCKGTKAELTACFSKKK